MAGEWPFLWFLPLVAGVTLDFQTFELGKRLRSIEFDGKYNIPIQSYSFTEPSLGLTEELEEDGDPYAVVVDDDLCSPDRCSKNNCCGLNSLPDCNPDSMLRALVLSSRDNQTQINPYGGYFRFEFPFFFYNLCVRLTNLNTGVTLTATGDSVAAKALPAYEADVSLVDLRYRFCFPEGDVFNTLAITFDNGQGAIQYLTFNYTTHDAKDEL